VCQFGGREIANAEGGIRKGEHTMKKAIQTLVAILFFTGSTVSLLAQGPDTQRSGPKRDGAGRYGTRTGDGQCGLVAALPFESLSQDEMEALMLMREEEKLARDVYLALDEIWDVPIFLNIATSEQRHFDTVGALIEKYELDDPAENETGVFADGSEMQVLYDEMVAAGSASLEEALRTGAAIEDLDIYDLRRLLERVDNRDIQLVFGNLLNGSMNHLRAFIRLLQPEVYEAQYLSQAEIDEIISSPRENGRYGNARGSCGMVRSGTDSGNGNLRRLGGGRN